MSKKKYRNRKTNAIILVCIPTYSGDVCFQCMASYTQAFIDCMKHDIILAPEFVVGFTLVQYARTWAVKQFMDNPLATHLLWLDSDLGFDYTAIRRLYETGKDVVGGSYTTKSLTKSIYPFVACGPVDEKTGLQEVTSMPGGFILMSRKAVEDLWYSSPEFTMEHGGHDHKVRHVCEMELVVMHTKDGEVESRLLGEDYIMQCRLRQLGYPLYLLTDIEFDHIGRRPWHGNVSKAYEWEKSQGLKTMWHPSAWAQANNKEILVTDNKKVLGLEKEDDIRGVMVSSDEVPRPDLLTFEESDDVQGIIDGVRPPASEKEGIGSTGTGEVPEFDSTGS